MTSTTEPRRQHSRTQPRDHERGSRRAALDVLLARAERGALSRAEAVVLRQYVTEEQRTADECRKANAGTTRALARNREAADAEIRALEQRALDAEEQLAAWRTVFGLGGLDTYRAAHARAERAEQQLAAVRALLPTGPRPRLGLPNDLAYANGAHDAYDAVRDALDQH